MYRTHLDAFVHGLLWPFAWLTFAHKLRRTIRRRMDLATAVVIEGTPISDELRSLFSPWGTVTGIVVDTYEMKVHFEDDTLLVFIPVTGLE